MGRSSALFCYTRVSPRYVTEWLKVEAEMPRSQQSPTGERAAPWSSNPTISRAFCYTETMLDIIAEVAGWVATILRASGMLAKKPLAVKLLVSGGNALWLANGIMKGNAPLIASNAICLVIMAIELVRNKIKK